MDRKPCGTCACLIFVGMSLELEFREYAEPYFFVQILSPIYDRGHFPCGITLPPDSGIDIGNIKDIEMIKAEYILSY